MKWLLFQWSRWDYKYLQQALGDDCQVVFSKDYSQRILRYLSGVLSVLRKSRRGDTIICWYDAQAVLCWWLCRLLWKKRNIVCINLLLKQKPTFKNRVATLLYKKALTSRNFKATVTSRPYGDWLNRKLGIAVDYTLLRDVYHDYYEMPQLAESHEDMVFCGGCYGRDWPLMMDIVRAMPEVKFCLVMMKEMEHIYFGAMQGNYPENCQVLTDIPYKRFMQCLCQSKIVCMPLDCEAPQGLIVMFEAAANDKLILTSDTPTTQGYFSSDHRLDRDVAQWCERIRFYLTNEDARKEKGRDFHHYLKEHCSERQFAATVASLC